MKKYTLSLTLVLISFSCLAQWNLVGPEGISNEWTVDNDIKTDTGGNPVVIFYENSSFYKASCLRFNGTQWEQMGKSTFDNFSIAYLLDFEIDNKNNYYILYLDSAYRTSCIRFNGDTWAFVGSPYILTQYSSFQSLAVDKAGIVYVAFQSQSGFCIQRENGESWIPVSINGLTGVDRYFDLVFDNENVAFFSYCGSNGKVPNCAKLVNDNWESVGSAISSTFFAAETNLLITKDHQIYTGFEHSEMGFYKYDNQTNKWLIIDTDGLGETFGGITNLISDSNSTIYISTSGDRARCYSYNGTSWDQLGDSGISESGAGYPNIALSKNDILYATYNDWISGKAVVKKFVKTSDIENFFQEDLVKVYPNIVKDQFCVELTGQKFAVIIYDTKGKLVFENTNGFDKIEIDSNLFNKGMYFVSVRFLNRTFNFRRIIVI